MARALALSLIEISSQKIITGCLDFSEIDPDIRQAAERLGLIAMWNFAWGNVKEFI